MLGIDPLFVLIAVELFALYRGQRQVFSWGVQLLPSWVMHVLIAPGVVMHELAHVLACWLALNPPVGIKLYGPTTTEDGTRLLGYVEHEQVGFIRQTFISIAPLLFIPVFLVGISRLLLGPQVFTDPIEAIRSANIFLLLIWGYVSLSAGQSAFPSSEDRIPKPGLVLSVLLAFIVLSVSHALLSLVAVVLILPSAMALILWWSLRILMHRKGLRPEGEGRLLGLLFNHD